MAQVKWWREHGILKVFAATTASGCACQQDNGSASGHEGERLDAARDGVAMARLRYGIKWAREARCFICMFRNQILKRIISHLKLSPCM